MSRPNKHKDPAWGEWHPLDSAPQDGTEFLAAYGDRVVLVRWDPAWGELTLRITPPSHWMPMPKPPARTELT
jgi:hypothetical protein